MLKPEQWGNVNLGVDVLQGHGEQNQPGKMDYDRNHPGEKVKQQYNPGRNQELNLNPELFNERRGQKNIKAGIHERIKELLGEGIPRREAILRAKAEADRQGHGDVGTITKKQVMAKKYQAPIPSKAISVFTSQVQNYPFI